MVDAISPRRRVVVGHWPHWSSRAAAAHSSQHYCAAGLVRPVSDKYLYQVQVQYPTHLFKQAYSF